jgi:hypothetical protein
MLEYRSKPHSGLDLAVTAARSSAPALPGPLHLRRDCRCCAGPVDFVRGPFHRDVSLQLKGFEVRNLLNLDGFFLQVIRFNQHSAVRSTRRKSGVPTSGERATHSIIRFLEFRP